MRPFVSKIPGKRCQTTKLTIRKLKCARNKVSGGSVCKFGNCTILVYNHVINATEASQLTACVFICLKLFVRAITQFCSFTLHMLVTLRRLVFLAANFCPCDHRIPPVGRLPRSTDGCQAQGGALFFALSRLRRWWLLFCPGQPFETAQTTRVLPALPPGQASQI